MFEYFIVSRKYAWRRGRGRAPLSREMSQSNSERPIIHSLNGITQPRQDIRWQGLTRVLAADLLCAPRNPADECPRGLAGLLGVQASQLDRNLGCQRFLAKSDGRPAESSSG